MPSNFTKKIKTNNIEFCDLNHPEVPCIDSNSKTPAKDVQEYADLQNQVFNGKYYAIIDNQPSGLSCFNVSVRSAALFVILFGIASLCNYGLHELFKVIFLLSNGIIPTYSWFGIAGGYTYISEYVLSQQNMAFQLIYSVLPLISDACILIIIILCCKVTIHEYHQFMNLQQTTSNLEIFIKAFGYVAALSIITSMFTPFLTILYDYMDIEFSALYSNLWETILNFDPNDSFIFMTLSWNTRTTAIILLFIFSGILLSLALYYFFGIGKKTF